MVRKLTETERAIIRKTFYGTGSSVEGCSVTTDDSGKETFFVSTNNERSISYEKRNSLKESLKTDVVIDGHLV